MKRGAFIVVEGLDRSGKSTQIGLIQQYLKQKGMNPVEWNFPDRSTTIGQSCDLYLRNKQNLNDKAIHLMFSANRWEKEQHLRELIESGTSIVCSRYAYSGVAYSGAKGMSLPWCRNCDVGLPEPDLVVFLDIDPEAASKRNAFGEERYEKVEFQKSVRRVFNQIFDWNRHNVQVVNASQTIEQVQKDIQDAIDKNLPIRLEKDLGLLWSDL